MVNGAMISQVSSSMRQREPAQARGRSCVVCRAGRQVADQRAGEERGEPAATRLNRNALPPGADDPRRGDLGQHRRHERRGGAQERRRRGCRPGTRPKPRPAGGRVRRRAPAATAATASTADRPLTWSCGATIAAHDHASGQSRRTPPPAPPASEAQATACDGHRSPEQGTAYRRRTPALRRIRRFSVPAKVTSRAAESHVSPPRGPAGARTHPSRGPADPQKVEV